jgi:hypothetical protein
MVAEFAANEYKNLQVVLSSVLDDRQNSLQCGRFLGF